MEVKLPRRGDQQLEESKLRSEDHLQVRVVAYVNSVTSLMFGKNLRLYVLSLSHTTTCTWNTSDISNFCGNVLAVSFC